MNLLKQIEKAVCENDIDKFEIIIENNSMEVIKNSFYYASKVICQKDNTKMISRFLNNNWEKCIDFDNLFIDAINFEAVNIIKLLIEIDRMPSLSNDKIISSFLRTLPLGKKYNFELVKLCLDIGYKCSAKTFIHLFHRTIRGDEISDFIRLIRILIEYGTDINMEYEGDIFMVYDLTCKKRKVTALDMAIDFSNLEIVRLLLQYDAKVTLNTLAYSVKVGGEIFKLIYGQQHYSKSELEYVRQKVKTDFPSAKN